MGTGDDSRLRAVVTEAVTGAGYDLEDLAVRLAGRRRVVKVVIDGDDGVTLDAAAEVSRAISARLDQPGESDPTGSAPYTLEVTSPGVGRPLTLPRHFRRARTRLVALTTTDGKDLTGHVLAADDTAVTLVLSGRQGISRQQVPISAIAKARVEVEFSPPPAAVLDLLGVRAPDEPVDLDDSDGTDDTEEAGDIEKAGDIDEAGDNEAVADTGPRVDLDAGAVDDTATGNPAATDVQNAEGDNAARRRKAKS